jgi:hypothetical protein
LEGWGRNNKQRNISRQESLHIPFLHHWDRLGCSEWSYLPMPPIFVNQSFPREESADQHIHDATQPLSQVPTAHVCPKRPCSFKSRPLAIGSRTLWPSSENISSQRLYLSRLEPF